MVLCPPVNPANKFSMADSARRVLVLGYGNPGRRDDGLGPEFAARVEALGLPEFSVETDYQLSIEHALLASHYDIVVFADAATDISDAEAFCLRPIEPAADNHSFSHSVSPQQVLGLARHCFNSTPEGWLLGIQPAEMDSFGEGLTPKAQANLAVALEAFLKAFTKGAAGRCGYPRGAPIRV
jgi:hydrogenase maturation protease